MRRLCGARMRATSRYLVTVPTMPACADQRSGMSGRCAEPRLLRQRTTQELLEEIARLTGGRHLIATARACQVGKGPPARNERRRAGRRRAIIDRYGASSLVSTRR